MTENPRRLIATTLALALCVVVSGCEWFAYPPAHKFPNVKVQFVNERTGWIIGPALLRTTDGGNSWQKLRHEGPGTIVSEAGIFDGKRFQFVDENVGFALGRNKGIYKTTDAGETWTEFALPVTKDAYSRFQSIFFLTGKRGWLFGADIYRTDNGCITWTKLGPATATNTSEPSMLDYYDPSVWFFNELHGLLVTMKGNIHRTRDGGATWQPVWSSNEFTLDLHFVNDKNGWIVGGEGFMARTRDGGDTWEKVVVPTKAQLHRLFFLNDQKGWAVGMHGAIIYTTDGGNTWVVANNSGTHSPLGSVHFIDERRGWAVGGDIFDDLDFSSVPSNLIIQTNDGGQNWTPQN